MLIMHLFVSYAHINLCHFFSSSWCRGLAADSACESWIFLFTFFLLARIHCKMEKYFCISAEIWLLPDDLQHLSVNSPNYHTQA